MKCLGLRMNLKKSVLSPKQRTTFLGIMWESTTMQALAYVNSVLTVRDYQARPISQAEVRFSMADQPVAFGRALIPHGMP